jgi:3-deoxy-D-manno-octulosonic-acid transferase
VDVWPELTTLAAARGTRVALVAATVDPGSARLGWLGRAMAERGYRALDVAAAISAEDAARLERLGTPRDRIVVTGDPRVDVVLEGVDRHRDGVLHDGSLLVAGSTWPGDESVLLDALVAIRRDHPQARLVIAPHEPTADHLAVLDYEIASRGLASTRWSTEGPPTDAVQVVDQMGVLAALYGRGAIAYVGGGFGGRGIHSVLEPAAWGRPVIIGPNDRGVRDAALLAEAGGLVRLPVQDPRAALVTRWRAWLEDPASRARAGDAARAALEGDRGAAERSAELLCSLLDTSACRFAQPDT